MFGSGILEQNTYHDVQLFRTRQEVLKIRNSRAWRNRTRQRQLFDFPFCQHCFQDDRLIDAVEVDHIVPLEIGGSAYDPSNLQSLCKRCHVIKSAKESRLRHHLKPH